MSKHIIHVNRQHIAMNAKDGKNRPVYTIKTGTKTRYAREVLINGPSKMIYDGTQLKCGARAWVETDSDITMIDEMSYAEAKTGKHYNISKCVKTSNNSELWLYNSKLHREDGPAVYNSETNIHRFYINGEEISMSSWIAEYGIHNLSSSELTALLLKVKSE